MASCIVPVGAWRCLYEEEKNADIPCRRELHFDEELAVRRHLFLMGRNRDGARSESDEAADGNNMVISDRPAYTTEVGTLCQCIAHRNLPSTNIHVTYGGRVLSRRWRCARR